MATASIRHTPTGAVTKTVKTRLAMADLAVGNLLAGLEDRHPPTLLNPQAWEHRTSRG
jgi:hypothetical protein